MLLKLTKISCYAKAYYKELAKYLNQPLLTINDEIKYEGEVVLYDHNKKNLKLHSIEEARALSSSLDMDLVLIKDGNPPSVQMQAYIYNIYKTFYLKFKKTKKPRTIQISANIAENDLNTKVMIAKQLMKKGCAVFRILGTGNSEENKMSIQKFCDKLGWKSDNITTQTAGEGKSTVHHWALWVNLPEVRLPLNYQALDKRFLKMQKYPQYINEYNERKKYWPGEEEDESDEGQYFQSKEAAFKSLLEIKPGQKMQYPMPNDNLSEDEKMKMFLRLRSNSFVR